MKKFIFVLILILLVIGCGAYFLLNKQTPSKPVDNSGNQQPVVDPNAPIEEEYLNPVFSGYVSSGDIEEVEVKEENQEQSVEISIKMSDTKPTWSEKAYKEMPAKEIKITNDKDYPIDYVISIKNVDTNLPQEEVRIIVNGLYEGLLYENAVLGGTLLPGQSTPNLTFHTYIDYYIDLYDYPKTGGYAKYDLTVTTEKSILADNVFDKTFVSYENRNLLFDGLLYNLAQVQSGNYTGSTTIRIDGTDYILEEQGTYSGNDYVYGIDLAPGIHDIEVDLNGYTVKGSINIQ